MIKVIFVCLISCCSWFMPLKDNLSCESQDQIQEVERKQRKDSFIYNSVGYYGSSDFSSYYFLSSLITYLTDTYSGYDNLKLDNDNYAGIDLYCPGTFSFNLYNPSTATYDTIMTFTNVKLSKFNQGNPSNNAYNLSFYGNPDAYQINYYWYLQQTNTIPTWIIGFGCGADSALADLFGNIDLSERGCIFEYSTQYAFLGKVTNNMFSGRDAIVYERGVTDGRAEGYESGVEVGYQQGYDVGKQAGYAEGIDYAQEQSSTALTIFTGILEVGLLPVNVFLKMFEYEVFGINIAGLISGLLTIAMIMIFIRFIFGGKDNGK